MLLQNRYQINSIIGEGGMGRVYLGIDRATNNKVAIKQIILPHSGVDIEKCIMRFQREYQFLSKINHPNIVKALDFFEAERSLFLVLEFIEGISLQDIIESHCGSIPFRDQLAIACQITRGIDVLNTAGILHRDIKPSNIMIDHSSGIVKILDLGIGRSLQQETSSLTNTGVIVGTMEYVSPEQVGGSFAKNSDVFSLGLVLYQFFLWERQSPLKGNSITSTLNNITTKDLPLLTDLLKCPTARLAKVYDDLSKLLKELLEKDAEKRIQSAKEVYSRLKNMYTTVSLINLDKKQDEKWQHYCSLDKTAQKTLQEIRGQRLKSTRILTKPGKTNTRTRRLQKQAPPKRSFKVVLVIFLVVNCILGTALLFYMSYSPSPAPKVSENSQQLFLQGKRLYLSGKYSQAKTIWEQAAKYNHPEAMAYLANIYHYGLVKRVNYPKAMMYYRKAAVQQNSRAIAGLAYLQLRGPGMIDYANVRKLLEECSSIDGEVQMYLGLLYKQGWGVEKSLSKSLGFFETAKRLLKQQADMGDIVCISKLALLHCNNNHTLENYQIAQDLFKKACLAGNAEAMFWLGNLHESGLAGNQDYQKALNWYQKSSELSYSEAMTFLGLLYENGKGVEQSYLHAKEWYEKSSNLGDPSGINCLARLYHYGWGVAKDFNKALELYIKSANLGYSVATRNLGLMYQQGEGVAQDYSKAAQLYQEAITKGNDNAKASLGILYYQGKGVPLDYTKAFSLIYEAADKGHLEAIENLGVLYYKGHGIEKNENKAIEIWKKGVTLGSEGCRQKLATVQK